jgi:hypothetical protein
MDEHAMSAFTSLPWPLTATLFFAAGFLLGLGYFRSLRRTTDMLLGAGSMLLVLALTLGRIAAIAAGFYLAAIAGTPALLAAFAGAMLGRAMVLRQKRGAP